VFNRFGVQHDRIIITANITGKDDARATPVELDRCRAKNVTRATQQNRGFTGQTNLTSKGYRLDALKNALGIVFGIERQRRLMLGEAMPVGKLRVLLLQVPGVGQQDCA
jgi:hypothetical protein